MTQNCYKTTKPKRGYLGFSKIENIFKIEHFFAIGQGIGDSEYVFVWKNSLQPRRIKNCVQLFLNNIKNIRKNVVPTAKGHLDQERKNLQSTKTEEKDDEEK